MTAPANMSVFSLVTAARLLADTLEGEVPVNAEIIRELCRRVVPVKIVPTRGKPMAVVPVAMPELIAPPVGKSWCNQCEALVDKGCGSKFCKVAA